MPTVTRRGLLRSIGSWFSPGGPKTYFVGVQVVIQCFGEDTLRARLVALMSEERIQGETVEEKRRFLKRLVALLLEVEPYWTYGYWDYKEGAQKAVAEYQGWVSEIEASIATEAEELGATVDGLHRTAVVRQYVVVTVLFLLDCAYAPAEVASEDDFFKRPVFHELIGNLAAINPHSIRADATYVVPGNPEDGLSDDDLATEGWSYLHPLWG
ncbi:MAG: DUF1517 domain-containing protein [Deltaproteobacteria bacterium]|nr:DUF1517 domain-containing protein [Deltaproteobacteria bacterium]